MPSVGRVSMTLRYCNLWKRKSTYFGIIERENTGNPVSMHAELEGWYLVGTKR